MHIQVDTNTDSYFPHDLFKRFDTRSFAAPVPPNISWDISISLYVEHFILFSL